MLLFLALVTGCTSLLLCIAFGYFYTYQLSHTPSGRIPTELLFILTGKNIQDEKKER
jgi:hypothetical protein